MFHFYQKIRIRQIFSQFLTLKLVITRFSITARIIEQDYDRRIKVTNVSWTCAVMQTLFLCLQVVGEYGMAHFSDEGKSKGKDYCIFFNSQWAHLPQDLNKAVSPNAMLKRRN